MYSLFNLRHRHMPFYHGANAAWFSTTWRHASRILMYDHIATCKPQCVGGPLSVPTQPGGEYKPLYSRRESKSSQVGERWLRAGLRTQTWWLVQVFASIVCLSIYPTAYDYPGALEAGFISLPLHCSPNTSKGPRSWIGSSMRSNFTHGYVPLDLFMDKFIWHTRGGCPSYYPHRFPFLGHYNLMPYIQPHIR